VRSRTTAIVAALSEEVGPLRARLLGARRLPIDAEIALQGTIAGHPVALVVTGDGERRARAGITSLLDQVRLDRLLVIGVSGALTSDLGPGALVVGSRVADEAGTFEAAQPLLSAALRRVGGRPATLITSERIADSPAERARLLQAFGEFPGAAAVDLESSVFVRAAQARGVPWLVVRAISDTAQERLPELLNQCRDSGGALRRSNLLRGLLLNPGAVPSLLSLRWRVGRCAQALACAAERLLWTERGATA
jgi:adenosylhomocysteine nucleosidase